MNSVYVEGQTVTIEWKWANEKIEKIAGLVTELVMLNVDVIVAPGKPANKALKDATSTIPIVMAAVGDPVGVGLVASLARRVETSLD